MKINEQYSSLFSASDNDYDYEEGNSKKKSNFLL